jgi:hypothetical protein
MNYGSTAHSLRYESGNESSFKTIKDSLPIGFREFFQGIKQEGRSTIIYMLNILSFHTLTTILIPHGFYFLLHDFVLTGKLIQGSCGSLVYSLQGPGVTSSFTEQALPLPSGLAHTGLHRRDPASIPDSHDTTGRIPKAFGSAIAG